MSHSRKHLTQDALNSFPEPNEKEQIARVIELRGSNICEIEYKDGQRLLCQMPSRFRKLIWIKRGNYLIVKQPPNATNYKVRALVEHVLFPYQIKHLKSVKMWPEEFVDVLIPRTSTEKLPSKNEAYDSDESDEDNDLFANPNRPLTATTYDNGGSESDDEEEDGEGSGEDRNGRRGSEIEDNAAPASNRSARRTRG